METKKKSVLFICADQWRWDCFGFMKHRNALTPNLDKLAKKGQGVAEEGGAGEFGTPELTKNYARETPGQCQEILNMNTADMGDVIKDFKKSDAPQFKGKSVEKRRQMAIAAKLSSQDKE